MSINSNYYFGFSLLELIIVLIILGILASIAIPQYQQYLTKARRADGKLALLNLAVEMERYYAEHQTFIGATIGPQGSVSNHIDSAEGYYKLAINQVTSTSFLLTATPVGSQFDNDKLCGTLSINQHCTKGNSGERNNSNCW